MRRYYSLKFPNRIVTLCPFVDFAYFDPQELEYNVTVDSGEAVWRLCTTNHLLELMKAVPEFSELK